MVVVVVVVKLEAIVVLEAAQSHHFSPLVHWPQDPLPDGPYPADVVTGLTRAVVVVVVEPAEVV